MDYDPYGWWFRRTDGLHRENSCRPLRSCLRHKRTPRPHSLLVPARGMSQESGCPSPWAGETFSLAAGGESSTAQTRGGWIPVTSTGMREVAVSHPLHRNVVLTSQKQTSSRLIPMRRSDFIHRFICRFERKKSRKNTALPQPTAELTQLVELLPVTCGRLIAMSRWRAQMRQHRGWGSSLCWVASPHVFASHPTKLRQKSLPREGHLRMSSIFRRSANAAIARCRRSEQP